MEPPEPILEPPEPEFELLPPPHPIAPAATAIQSSKIMAIQRRRRAGNPSRSSPARIVPPPRPGRFIRVGASIAVVDAAVVFTVSTVDPVPPVVIVTLVGLRPHVGRLCAPVGELASVQLIFIVPE